MQFLVTLEPDETGYWVADCPALPGCLSQGRTREETLENIREAILLSLETRKAHDLPASMEVAESLFNPAKERLRDANYRIDSAAIQLKRSL